MAGASGEQSIPEFLRKAKKTDLFFPFIRFLGVEFGIIGQAMDRGPRGFSFWEGET
jgi:hypothetical protein